MRRFLRFLVLILFVVAVFFVLFSVTVSERVSKYRSEWENSQKYMVQDIPNAWDALKEVENGR